MVKSALFGLATGDALGVPAEFKSREELRLAPITTMQGYGTYNIPPGTFSDDTSLACCLAETLCAGYSPELLASMMLRWMNDGFWAVRGEVFDIGNTTRAALTRIEQGTPPAESGSTAEEENGNGALMRILPLAFYIKNKTPEERMALTAEVAGITHAHPRSTLCCAYYLEYARLLLRGDEPWKAYTGLQPEFSQRAIWLPGNTMKELSHLSRLLESDITKQGEDAIQSSGYVVDTLEAAIWCLLTTESYRECVLKAVNLGRDTDTTAAVAGGLAGIVYGYDGIPEEWTHTLGCREDLALLAARMDAAAELW